MSSFFFHLAVQRQSTTTIESVCIAKVYNSVPPCFPENTVLFCSNPNWNNMFETSVRNEFPCFFPNQMQEIKHMKIIFPPHLLNVD